MYAYACRCVGVYCVSHRSRTRRGINTGVNAVCSSLDDNMATLKTPSLVGVELQSPKYEGSTSSREELSTSQVSCLKSEVEDDVSARNPRLKRWGMYAIPFIAGLVNPVMGGLNGLGKETVGSVYLVVAIVYTLNFIGTAMWAWWTSRATLRDNWAAVGEYVFAKPSHWAVLLGGTLGACQHVLLTLVSAEGGTGVFTLGALLGSIITGIVLDLTGLCWSRKERPRFLVYVGAVAVSAGAIIHSLPVLMGNEDVSPTKQILLILISCLSGMCMCCQACVGNKLGSLIGGLRRAAVWSFGSGALLMYFIGPYADPDARLSRILVPRNWWRMCQAPLAAYGLIATALSQRKMPGAVVYCWVIVGQLTSATIVDSLGWLGLEQRPIDLFGSIGLAVVIVGVLLVTLARLQKHSSKRPQSLTEASLSSQEP
eukprot:Gregarina_sp_Poly_1__3721@NODE_20_length_21312_cov_69_583714_g18_i0_p6_GENE_NODE_20_length_21312_cov_69_583714_g18_i0NODE_20_length_21312_cov_69_583714_g18_i0_p6_ORF_typecomplete_len427_score26_00DMT_YdcZ/PF04657_13/8_9e13DMT_YdcZ/PF04657_13/6e17PgaD/PF13994_6/1_9e02PgaD/PF13994_6/5_1e03PgaD/PF13994_6/0_33DUF3382/PF11862_8/3e02DUF3382/PF11862_8/0_73PIRT/PF15099_6/8_5e02PIRT/PF15099_6/4_2e02PIRT/PF15099_6/90PIRT/PF15099_6/3_7CRTlike/PF08627_10/1CRTlike/PF08627_10/17DUF2976/PF11190_8/2_5DUF2976/PF